MRELLIFTVWYKQSILFSFHEQFLLLLDIKQNSSKLKCWIQSLIRRFELPSNSLDIFSDYIMLICFTNIIRTYTNSNTEIPISLRFSKILTSFNISVWNNLFDKNYSGVRVIRSVQLHGFRLNSVLWFPHVRFVFSPNLFYRGINFVFIYVPWSGTWFYTRCWWCRLTITGPVPPVKQALLTILKRTGSSPLLWGSFCSILRFQCSDCGL